MKSIYKSEEGKNKILALYDEQLSSIKCQRPAYVQRVMIMENSP